MNLDVKNAEPELVEGVEWRVSPGLVDYAEALAWQERRAAEIAAGAARECVWLLEHPPVITAGASAQDEELLAPGRFPVHKVGRGGRHTYHGPGQRVVYAILDLNRRGRDVRAYVANLEAWVIRTLAALDVAGETRRGRVGVWTPRPDKPLGPNGAPVEEKIAAIGVRVRRWVAFHGFAINIDPDLSHFATIVPCGLQEFGVTSLADLGVNVDTPSVDLALRRSFAEVFGSAKNT